jgi:hypothetical protein
MKGFFRVAIFTVIAFSIASLMFISCEDSSTNPDKTMEVSGFVKDVSGTPVPDAVVSAFLADKLIESDSTDINGLFTLLRIPSENNDAVMLQISHPSYNTQKAKLSEFLANKINGKVPVLLSNDTCCSVIKVIVKDSATGNFIYDAEVKLRKGDQDAKLKRTDSSGTVLFDSVCTGNFSLRISKQNYRVVEQSFSLDSCQSKIIEVTMAKLEDCCGKLEFIVKDKITGEVINGATVKITKAEGQFTSTKYTADNGKVQFGELCMGKYFIRISKGDAYNVIEDYSDVENCDLKSLEYKLEPRQNDCCGKLIIKVTDKTTGDVIAGAEVRLNQGQTVIGTKNTSAEGYAVFEKICPNTYWIRVFKTNYKVVEQDGFKYTGCDTINTEIKLEKNPTDSCCNNKVYIEPQDSTTKVLIKNATVKLWKNGSLFKTLTTGDLGVTFNELCKGAYGVSISAENYKGIEFQFEVNCLDSKEFVKYMAKIVTDTCCLGKAKLIVKDSVSGEVIKNASVKLWKGNQLISTKSTELGYANFEQLCQGNYQFSVSATGYTSFEYNFEQGCNVSWELTKAMKKVESDTCCLGKAKIIIKDDATGDVIKNATVKLWKGGQLIATKNTEAGYAMFEQLCQATYGVNVTAEGYTGFEFSFQQGCNQTQEIVKTMKKTSDTCCLGKSKITIKDYSSGEVIKYATVKLWKGSQLISTKTTSLGYVNFEQLCQTTYGVSVTASGYTGFEFNFEQGCNQTQEIVKTMKRLDSCDVAVIRIVARDKVDNTVIAGAHVVVKRNGTVVAEGNTNAEGGFGKENLHAPAEYQITVSKDGYEGTTFEMKFTECKTWQETGFLTKQ